MLAGDLLAFGMAEMLRMPGRAMQVTVTCRHRNLLHAVLVARQILNEHELAFTDASAAFAGLTFARRFFK